MNPSGGTDASVSWGSNTGCAAYQAQACAKLIKLLNLDFPIYKIGIISPTSGTDE